MGFLNGISNSEICIFSRFSLDTFCLSLHTGTHGLLIKQSLLVFFGHFYWDLCHQTFGRQNKTGNTGRVFNSIDGDLGGIENTSFEKIAVFH